MIIFLVILAANCAVVLFGCRLAYLRTNRDFKIFKDEILKNWGYDLSEEQA